MRINIFRAAAAEVMINCKYIALGAALGSIAGYYRGGIREAISLALLFGSTQTLCYGLSGANRYHRDHPSL